MFRIFQRLFLTLAAVGGLTVTARGGDKPTPEPDLGEYLDLARFYIKPPAEQRDKKTGFVVGGKNDTALIRKLTSLNGRPIADLEADMRPGAVWAKELRAKGMFGSEKGFLGGDERLLEVLAADNDYVVGELKLTHQALAAELNAVGSIALWKRKVGEPSEFTLDGSRFRVTLTAWRGFQHSPFLDDTKTNCDVEVVNLDNRESLSYSLLVPLMVERYGFYEGRGTPYRVEPKKVVAVFPGLTNGKALSPCKSEGRASAITAEGRKLAEFLDQQKVEERWLPGQIVEWETGKKVKDAADGQPHTHCSAFAAAVCKLKSVYLLRPPEHSATHLANAQFDWLREHGAEKGWASVATAAEAQRKVNLGHLVVAVYQESDPKKHGHIAIVRPSDKGETALRDEGPQVIQAGLKNAASTTLKDGFQSHLDAWKGDVIRYYAHDLSWK